MAHIAPKTTPAPPQTGRPSTRGTPPTTVKKGGEGTTNTEVKTTQDAYAYLTSKDYLVRGAPVTNNSLATAVFQISQASPGMSKSITDAFRAIAFILEDITVEGAADSIARAVLEKLTNSINIIQGASDDVGVALDHLRGEATKNTQTIDDFREEIQGVTDKITQAAQEAIDNAPAPTLTQECHTSVTQPSFSYAEKTCQFIPPVHATIISKGNATERQVLVERAPGIEDNGLLELSEKELVVKAKTSLDLMGIFAEDRPKGMTFIAARKLRGGSVIYQLESVASAAWLRKSGVMASFITHFGGTSIIKTRLIYVVAEYVPRWWNENSQAAREQVEKDNDLPKGVMLYSKYIKPPRYHKPSQKTAHAILGFTSREAANHAIEHGLFMDGKRVFTRKLLPEPKRCMKCQSLTGHHVAATCKADHDTCARCAQHHRTADCTMNNDGAWRCANCEAHMAEGHGAADRQCPFFLTLLTKLHARIPETKYKYFPTDNPHSWKLVDQADIYTNDQDVAWQQGVNWSGDRTQAKADGDRTTLGRGGQSTQRERQGSGNGREMAGGEYSEDWGMARERQGHAGRGSRGWGAGERATDQGWTSRTKSKGIAGYFTQLPKVREEPIVESRTAWGDSPMAEEPTPITRQRSNSAPQGPIRANNDHSGPTS